MGRYFKFDGNTFDFATRADVSWRYEYWNEFVFGGERDQRVYGLTKITPSITAEYDLNGLKFLKYALGSLEATGVTVTVSDLPQIATIHAGVDGIWAGILDAKIDTWSMSVEENGPVKAEFTAIGKNTTSATATVYSADFCTNVMMASDVSVVVGTNTIDYTRFNLNINNGLEPIFKGSTIPQTIRPTGLEIDGRIRVADYLDTDIVNTSLAVHIGTIGDIYIPIIKITEIPPRVTGYDLPEAEYAFNGYPGCTVSAIWANLDNTIKW